MLAVKERGFPYVTTASMPSEKEATQGPGPVILVVEDSPTIRMILEICLRRAGFEVQGCEDGIQAMKWLAQSEKEPALILLDVIMPYLDGFEVARRIKAKERFRHTVIVMLTCQDGMLNMVKARLAGASAYLTKPFKIEQLLAVVRSFVGEGRAKG